MKTFFLKIGMPVMAFMLAITFAFASEKTTAKDDTLVIGYIFENGVCKPASRDCNNVPGPMCKQGALQVYATQLSGTLCINELTHWQ